MSIIYEPKGRAREYSPLALNIYMGCTHRCKYCYAPSCIQKAREEYYCIPSPRKNLTTNLRKELEKIGKGGIKKQVLLSFVGDVYCETTDSNKTTREVLEMLLEYEIPVAILTKGAIRCLNDLDIFKKFGKHIQVGTTLTFDNTRDSLEWEPGASTPNERYIMLRELHNNGIRTFVSFEPVIYPDQTLNLARKTLQYVDVYKIGKINNYRGIDKEIDWHSFLGDIVGIMRDAGKEFYIKEDLAKFAGSLILTEEEVNADIHGVY